MTMAMGGDPFPLGPGTLHIGLTGTLIDVSCLVNNAVIAADKDQGDDVTKLCGTVVPGSVNYSYTLSGNMDTDIGLSTGFFALTWEHAGEQLSYEYTPNTGAVTKAVGTLVVDPLDFGGDETTEIMASDFEFALVGKPTFTYGTGAAADSDDSEQEAVAV